MTKDDPTIAQIKKRRHEISQQFNHNPKEVVEYYIELQKKYQDRLIDESEIEKDVEYN